MRVPRRAFLRFLPLMAAVLASIKLPLLGVLQRAHAEETTSEAPLFNEAWLRERLSVVAQNEGSELEAGATQGFVPPDVEAAARAAGYTDTLTAIREIAAQIKEAALTGCYGDLLPTLQLVAPSVLTAGSGALFAPFQGGTALSALVTSISRSKSLPSATDWQAARSSRPVTAASLTRLRELARAAGLLKEALAAQHVVAGLVTARAAQISRALDLPNDAAAVGAFYWSAGAELGLAAATDQPLDQLDSYRLLGSVGDGVFLTTANL